MTTPDKIGSFVMRNGGGNVPATMDMIAEMIDATLEDFLEAVQNAHDQMTKDAASAVVYGQEADEAFKQLSQLRTLAETISVMHAAATVSYIDKDARTAAAGAAYMKMVPVNSHAKVRDALSMLAKVHMEKTNNYVPSFTVQGWNIDR